MAHSEPAILCTGPLGRMQELQKRLAGEGIPAEVVAPPGAKGNS